MKILRRRAAASDASDAIKALANAGSEIDAQTSNGSTALHVAAASGKKIKFWNLSGIKELKSYERWKEKIGRDKAEMRWNKMKWNELDKSDWRNRQTDRGQMDTTHSLYFDLFYYFIYFIFYHTYYHLPQYYSFYRCSTIFLNQVLWMLGESYY